LPIDLDLVEADFLHLLLDAQHDLLFVGAFAGDGDHVAQEARHVGLVVLGSLEDVFEGDLFAAHGAIQSIAVAGEAGVRVLLNRD
jgi:hypothetical protein